jgi:Domain of unknown function (DUF2017)
MRISRSGETVRIRLNVAEAHVLDLLLQEMQELLVPDRLDPSDPVRKRLYPAGYQDDAEASVFRELTEGTLQRERSERLEQCLAELHGARSLRRTEVVLDADAADRWMRVLNDLRLTYGTRLDITEDDEYELNENDPDVQLRARYLWLTALQDGIVGALLD